MNLHDAAGYCTLYVLGCWKFHPRKDTRIHGISKPRMNGEGGSGWK